VTVKARNTTSVVVPGRYGSSRLTFRLSPQTPTDLRVNGGAGELDLNLRDLKIQSVNVNAGVGGAKIVLPQAAGRTTAQVNAGVGGMELTIPQGVAAEITVDTGVGGVDIDEGRFAKTGRNTYRSRDYDTAANRVVLDVSAGVGGVSIR
jgi:hypothetical protein